MSKKSTKTSNSIPKKISEEALANILRENKRISGDTKFCFLLGAGASVSSGISAGGKLASTWYEELKADCETPAERGSLTKWSNRLKIHENPGNFYCEIYKRKFGHCPEMGYNTLAKEMEGKEPSLGYLILANIMVREKHNVVITPNFDNLLEKAIRTYTGGNPFIAGHEALASYVPKRSDRPIILKVHRDLYLQPISDTKGTNKLHDQWSSVLSNFLADYYMIVIGYGGNDGSLMDYLKGINRKPIYWCLKKGDKLPEKAKRLLTKDDFIVEISGFDGFMCTCYRKLGYVFLKDIGDIKIDSPHNLLDSGYHRVRIIKEKIVSLIEGEENLSIDERKHLKTILSGAYKFFFEAIEEKDLSKREDILKKGIATYQKNADLLNQYAIFLKKKKEYDKAEEFYLKAIEADEAHANSLGNYALFLENVRKDYERAEEFYKKAIKADGFRANNLGNYAIFLESVRKDYDKAEEFYRRAIEADGRHANSLGNYAIFLEKVRKDDNKAEELYKKAIEADETHANSLGNYAVFLENIRKDYDKAEFFFQSAIKADKEHANNLVNYAIFLKNIRKDYDKAERLYKKAIKVDGMNFNTLGNYAIFLEIIRKDHEKAEEYFLKAMRLDKANASSEKNQKFYFFFDIARQKYSKAEEIRSRVGSTEEEEEEE